MPAQKLRVSAIQFSAVPGAVQRNLQIAGELVHRAASSGAHLILLPELTPGGYVLTEEIWNTAETMRGQSVAWLKSIARQFGVYLGMSFLEVEESDFFNSFVLATPAGDIAGRVRKAPPASAEAYFSAREMILTTLTLNWDELESVFVMRLSCISTKWNSIAKAWTSC